MRFTALRQRIKLGGCFLKGLRFWLGEGRVGKGGEGWSSCFYKSSILLKPEQLSHCCPCNATRRIFHGTPRIWGVRNFSWLWTRSCSTHGFFYGKILVNSIPWFKGIITALPCYRDFLVIWVENNTWCHGNIIRCFARKRRIKKLSHQGNCWYLVQRSFFLSVTGRRLGLNASGCLSWWVRWFGWRRAEVYVRLCWN